MSSSRRGGNGSRMSPSEAELPKTSLGLRSDVSPVTTYDPDPPLELLETDRGLVAIVSGGRVGVVRSKLARHELLQVQDVRASLTVVHVRDGLRTGWRWWRWVNLVHVDRTGEV